MTKSEAAFRFTAQKFLETYEPVFFWCFTFKEVMPDWYYSRTFAGFSRQLQNLYGGTLRGVRVMEMHETHGMHYHALINKRIWAGLVRRLGARFGIGRVHVQKVWDNDHAIDYLAKYLSKQAGEKFHARCSKWGTMGGFKGTRVRDIEVESNLSTAIKAVQAATGCRRMTLPLLQSVALETTSHGLSRAKFFPEAARLCGRAGEFHESVTLMEDIEWAEETQPF